MKRTLLPRLPTFLAILIAVVPVHADAAQPQPSIALEIPDGARAGPDFDVARATQAYIELLSEEQRERSDAYFEGGYWLQLWGFLYGLGVAWLLLATRLSAKMRNLSERITRRKPIQTGLYAIQYIILATVLSFPLTLYQGFFREHQYDLATQTFGPWLGDQLKGLMVGLVLGTMAMILVYGTIRKAPRTWWMWGGVVGVGFMIFAITISPVYIAPLFNEYKPLEPGPIREDILSMARANGVPADDVYWFDASRQSTRISANVSGLFGTMRISLNDNLLEGTSPEEIEVVMAHELGHYILHVPKLITYFGLIIVVGFAFVKWSADKVLKRWGDRWDVRSVGDNASLPLLIALFSIYGFVITPISNSIVRVTEAEADIFGLNVAGQPDGFARAAMRLSTYRKISPGPLEEFIFYDHPSGRSRVHMAMQWKAENLDTQP